MPPSTSLARPSGQSWSLVVLAVFLFLQGGFVAWTACTPQSHAAWQKVIANPLWPMFTDLRIMANGWEEGAAGFDPLRTDGDAPNYNYPRFWLLGGKLGWRLADVPWLGVLNAALFLAAVFAVERTAPGWTRLPALFLLTSPAICLGLERGNSDLLIFALVTPALLADSSIRNWRSLSAPWVLVFAGMLKLFPVVALASVLIRAHRAVWISAILGSLVFAAYLVTTHKDIEQALAKTERGQRESYGLSLAAAHWNENWAPSQSGAALISDNIATTSPPEPPTARWIAGALLLTTLASLGWRRTRHTLLGTKEPPLPAPAAVRRLFLAGTSIFLFTFLFAHSWAYRLIFLLWTLPLLGFELKHGHWRRRIWAGAALVLIIWICWGMSSGSPTVLGWTHAACFALMPVLILVATAALDWREAPQRASHKLLQRALWATMLAAGVVLMTGDLGSSLTKRGFSSTNTVEIWSLAQRAKTTAANGDIQTAIALLKGALRLDPNYADAHAQLGAALWQAGRDNEARQHLNKAIALQPRSIKARNTLAGIYRQQRRWDEAITGYRESLAIRPEDIATLNQLGLTCLESGRPSDARQWLEQARQLRPDHAETERNLGIVSAALNRPEEASGHFQRALQLKPDYADAELQWGFVLARSGRLPEALAHFQQAVKLAPESGQAHFVLAMALRELGRTPEGEAHYREALRLEPSLAPR